MLLFLFNWCRDAVLKHCIIVHNRQHQRQRTIEDVFGTNRNLTWDAKFIFPGWKRNDPPNSASEWLVLVAFVVGLVRFKHEVVRFKGTRSDEV